MASPPARVARARNVLLGIVVFRKPTWPSAKGKFTPPGRILRHATCLLGSPSGGTASATDGRRPTSSRDGKSQGLHGRWVAPLHDRGKSPHSGSTLRVLVVDDNRDAADTMRVLVNRWGYDCLVAYDGFAGLKAAREYRPDCMLLDIGLPGLDGYALVRRVKACPGLGRRSLSPSPPMPAKGRAYLAPAPVFFSSCGVESARSGGRPHGESRAVLGFTCWPQSSGVFGLPQQGGVLPEFP